MKQLVLEQVRVNIRTISIDEKKFNKIIELLDHICRGCILASILYPALIAGKSFFGKSTTIHGMAYMAIESSSSHSMRDALNFVPFRKTSHVTKKYSGWTTISRRYLKKYHTIHLWADSPGPILASA
jgi:hypothetical protein